MSPAIEAVAFDKDGVIFDSEMIYHKTLIQSLEHFNIPFDDEFANQFQGVSAPKTYEILSQSIQDYVNVDEFVASWMAAKDEYYKQYGVAIVNGIEEVVKEVYSRGYPLALVTSDTQENMLRDFSITQPELLSYFSVVITLDDVSKAKPNPEPYIRAASLLGVESDHLLVIEDSDVGAIAASDSGANVLLYRPHGLVENNIEQKTLNIIKHPSQLMDYLS